jgi:hypothetical protein
MKRQPGSAGSVLPSSSPNFVSGSPLLPPSFSSSPYGIRQSHSRQGSQTSWTGSSITSSPSVLGQIPTTLDVLPNSRRLVDKEALGAMRVAVEAAPKVWEMMDGILDDIPKAQADGKDILVRAKLVTDRLRESIRALQQGDANVDRKTMREDAHAFVKARPIIERLGRLC